MKHLVAGCILGFARALSLAATVCASIGLSLAQPTTGGPGLVKVDGGMVRGMVTNDLIVFKGIPFAEPPVGELRWRPPRPVSPWEGIRDALAFGPNPVQPVAGQPQGMATSEDCLYLNVWRPASPTNKPSPVMVWIYGGGLVRGAASIYPGEFLARQGIVFVSFNYRLGRLGFFAHPALAIESPGALRGNYGYMDQIAALQWVQRNIAAFDGDPNNVTIAGESAGGGSVLVLLTSPMARGLFHRAILESPGIPTARAPVLPLRELAAAESIAVEFARGVGVRGDDAAALKPLRALSVETLNKGTEAYVLAMSGGPEIPGLSHSIIDGRLIVEPPELAFRAGRQAKVPVIVGANDFDLASSPALTKEALFAPFGVMASQARALYDPKGDASIRELIQAILSDRSMVEPARYLAELVAKSGQPAYFYRFSYVAGVQRGRAPGATHAAEIIYALGGIAASLKQRAIPDDVAMGRRMSGYWSAFVKTGDPNGDGRPIWPRYDPASREVLNFTQQGVTVGPDPLKERLDLWRSVWEQGR